MYDIIEIQKFKDVIKQCRPFCIMDIDIQNDYGKIISKSEIYRIVDRSTEIRCYTDDMLIRYDLFYMEHNVSGLARVLMTI